MNRINTRPDPKYFVPSRTSYCCFPRSPPPQTDISQVYLPLYLLCVRHRPRLSMARKLLMHHPLRNYLVLLRIHKCMQLKLLQGSCQRWAPFPPPSPPPSPRVLRLGRIALSMIKLLRRSKQMSTPPPPSATLDCYKGPGSPSPHPPIPYIGQRFVYMSLRSSS